MSAYVLIPLYNRARGIIAWTRVDASDAERVAAYCWRRTYYGYAVTGTPRCGTQQLLHRLLLELPNGEPYRHARRRYRGMIINVEAPAVAATEEQAAPQVARTSGQHSTCATKVPRQRASPQRHG